MQFSDEFIQQWEHIIKDVDATEIPIECLKKVVIKLGGKKQKTINIQTLKKQGLDYEEIESVVARNLFEYGDDVRDLDFVLDIGAVAEMVQPETDKLLKGMG